MRISYENDIYVGLVLVENDGEDNPEQLLSSTEANHEWNIHHLKRELGKKPSIEPSSVIL